MSSQPDVLHSFDRLIRTADSETAVGCLVLSLDLPKGKAGGVLGAIANAIEAPTHSTMAYPVVPKYEGIQE